LARASPCAQAAIGVPLLIIHIVCSVKRLDKISPLNRKGGRRIKFLTVAVCISYGEDHERRYSGQGGKEMMNLHFARQFLRHPKQLGTFTESGRVLAREMADEVVGCSCVVEFGPGTGPVTREILKRLPQDGALICFEINPDFCRDLTRICDRRLRVINDDALNCRKYVEDPDCVVSGLPLTLFDRWAKERILEISSRSKTYIQLQYAPVLNKEIRQYFSDVRLKFVPRNIPPAFVYVCRRSGNGQK
jgi:phospholipid N-methyltransferase